MVVVVVHKFQFNQHVKVNFASNDTFNKSDNAL